MKARFLIGVLFLSQNIWATPAKKEGRWLLKPFLNLSARDPGRLLRIAAGYYKPERLERSRKESALAFEWQDRLALITALSDFFDPQSRVRKDQKEAARGYVKKALLEDPALLVRDGAVESIRRIVRMNPDEARHFHGSLEKAFLHSKNVIQGEGLFIRETILTTMREGSLRPSVAVVKAARRDENFEVRNLADLWETRAYSSLR